MGSSLTAMCRVRDPASDTAVSACVASNAIRLMRLENFSDLPGDFTIPFGETVTWHGTLGGRFSIDQSKLRWKPEEVSIRFRPAAAGSISRIGR